LSCDIITIRTRGEVSVGIDSLRAIENFELIATAMGLTHERGKASYSGVGGQSNRGLGLLTTVGARWKQLKSSHVSIIHQRGMSHHGQ
jgi:hypothetical protein